MSASDPTEQHLILLGQAIRHTREERGVSVDALALASGLHRRRLQALEAGHLDPTYDQLLALADALGVQPSALVLRAEALSASPEP
ncbi:MAG TPA: helix-turn-helix transcriptional regulator [Solirubrobacteraceae bacterium]|nr:helix-turn-helix transcriptional regulator [Solirubrobacteraceae bacterium]